MKRGGSSTAFEDSEIVAESKQTGNTSNNLSNMNSIQADRKRSPSPQRHPLLGGNGKSPYEEEITLPRRGQSKKSK